METINREHKTILLTLNNKCMHKSKRCTGNLAKHCTRSKTTSLQVLRQRTAVALENLNEMAKHAEQCTAKGK